MPALSFRDLSFAHRNGRTMAPLYEHFSLDIMEGGVTAIMGDSGCGKSTLGKLAGGLISPAAGAICWSEQYASPRDHFYVDQDPKKVIFPNQTVQQNIAHPLQLLGWSQVSIRKRVEELLDATRLTHCAREYPKDLSGGEKSRLSFARVFSWEPRAVILDECLTGLDLNTREIMLMLLSERAASPHFTTVLITHTVYEAVRLANRCVILGKQPVQILRDVEIKLPIPRDVESLPFAEYQQQIISLLRNEL